MLSSKLNSQPTVVGEITIPLKPLIEGVLQFISTYLPLFPATLRSIFPPLETEKLLNQQLVDFFNGNSLGFDCSAYVNYRFIFRKDDERSDTQSKPDIGVTIWHKASLKSEHNSFFQVECKRLPTPNPSTKRSKKEYVRGTISHKGGIDRFKRGEHGAHLDEGAIIGYVQDNTCNYWHNQITEWINEEIANKANDLHWYPKDHLLLLEEYSTGSKYSSTCSRENSTDILLYHFLILIG